jgi:hypothetical protein
MQTTHRIATAIALSIALVALAEAKPNQGKGNAKGRPERGSARLDIAGVDDNARGKIDAKHFPAVGKREERSWLRVKVGHLETDATYTLWMDDPTTTDDAALVEVAGVTLVPGHKGATKLKLDTKKGDALPFGATLADLGGMLLEVRDEDGNAVLTGSVPVLQ